MLGIFHSLGLESIDFQKDDYHLKMEKVCSDIMETIKSNIKSGAYGEHEDMYAAEIEKDEALKKPLIDLIFNRFGIKVKPLFAHDAYAAVIPSYINYNHIFAPKEAPFYYEYGAFGKELLQIKNRKQQSATIDLEKAKVGGFFSEIEHDMFYHVPMMIKDSLTPREFAAIITHEIGHIFTFMEYCYKLNATNQVFQSLCDEVIGKNEKKQKEIILKDYKFGSSVKPEDIEEIINSETKVVLGYKLFKVFKLEVTDLMNKSHYNQATSEQMADNFAVRMGLGRELVTSLDKIHRAYRNPNYGLMNVMHHVLTFMLYVLVGVVAIMLGIMIPIFASFSVIAVMFLISLILGERESNLDRTYDEVKDRFMRVRHQIIEQLKNKNMPKHEIKSTLESLEEITKIVNDVGRYRGIINRLFKIFSSKDREAFNEILNMRDLEELAHNELFVSSAKLQSNG